MQVATSKLGTWLVFAKKKSGEGANGEPTPLLSPKHAAYINKALDDGKPNSGQVQSGGEGCLDGNNYNLANKNKVCILYVKLD